MKAFIRFFRALWFVPGLLYLLLALWIVAIMLFRDYFTKFLGFEISFLVFSYEAWIPFAIVAFAAIAGHVERYGELKRASHRC